MKYDVGIIGAGPGGIFAAYELAEKSKTCAEAKWASDGKARGTGNHIDRLTQLFARLTAEERDTLAQYALDAYMSGIHDTLCDLEWYIDCRDMKITVEGEELPTKEFEGIGNDFIGRRSGWEWPV